MLGLRFCARAFSSCSKQGPLFIAVHRPHTIAASLLAEHQLQTRRLSNCGSRAWLLRGMWDLPRPGLEPMSPALAGRLPTTAPPGKPSFFLFLNFILFFYTAGSYSSILYILVYICQSQSPSSSHHHHPPSLLSPLVSIRLFSTSVSLFLPCKPVHLYHFSSSTYMR